MTLTRWRRPAICGLVGVVLVVASMSRWGTPEPPAGSRGVAGGHMVVAAADASAGTVLTDALVELGAVGVERLAPSAVADPASLVGRRLAVSVHRGDPVLVTMTVAAPPAAPGRRVVDIRVPADVVTLGLAPGASVDVVAALDQPLSPSGHAEEHVVALATVVGVGSLVAGSGVPSPLRAPVSAATGDGASTTLSIVLDCASGDALRVLWARDFAREVRLVVRPAGDKAPLDSSGGPAG